MIKINRQGVEVLLVAQEAEAEISVSEQEPKIHAAMQHLSVLRVANKGLDIYYGKREGHHFIVVMHGKEKIIIPVRGVEKKRRFKRQRDPRHEGGLMIAFDCFVERESEVSPGSMVSSFIGIYVFFEEFGPGGKFVKVAADAPRQSFTACQWKTNLKNYPSWMPMEIQHYGGEMEGAKRCDITDYPCNSDSFALSYWDGEYTQTVNNHAYIHPTEAVATDCYEDACCDSPLHDGYAGAMLWKAYNRFYNHAEWTTRYWFYIDGWTEGKWYWDIYDIYPDPPFPLMMPHPITNHLQNKDLPSCTQSGGGITFSAEGCGDYPGPPWPCSGQPNTVKYWFQQDYAADKAFQEQKYIPLTGPALLPQNNHRQYKGPNWWFPGGSRWVDDVSIAGQAHNYSYNDTRTSTYCENNELWTCMRNKTEGAMLYGRETHTAILTTARSDYLGQPFFWCCIQDHPSYPDYLAPCVAEWWHQQETASWAETLWVNGVEYPTGEQGGGTDEHHNWTGHPFLHNYDDSDQYPYTPDVRYYFDVSSAGRQCAIAHVPRRAALDYRHDFYGVWTDDGKLFKRSFARHPDRPAWSLVIPEFDEFQDEPVYCNGTFRIVAWSADYEDHEYPEQEVIGG
jgi:hypothetical protein